MITAIVYILLLMVWSVIVAYIILFMLIPSIGKKDAHGGHGSHGHAPPPPKVAHYARETRDYSTHEGFKSFAKKENLTIDDIVKGLSKGN